MLIAQITDAHIVEKNAHWLSEPSTQTAERLQRVVLHLNQMQPQPNVVLFTGDVSDTGTFEAYAHIKELLSSLRAPVFVIPGNHDSREEMRKAFLDKPYMPSQGFIQYSVDHFPIKLVALDTHVEGEPHGELCQARWEWLEKILREESEKPILIFMHHPPAKTGTKLFDQIACQVPSHFEELMLEKSNLLGIISGHYHHFCITSFGTKPCFIAPSIAPVHYFAHPDDEFVTALELEDPAITLHKWQGKNFLTSHVLRVKDHVNRIDWKKIKH